MVMLHVTNWMTINVNNTGNRLKTGAVNGPENTSHSIKRGIESCKTETAGYTSLDIGFISGVQDEIDAKLRLQIWLSTNLVFRSVGSLWRQLGA